MTFKDLLKHKDDCCENYVLAEDELKAAQAGLDVAIRQHAEHLEAERMAHQAIHDHLTEFGAHCDIDKDGTVTIYTALDGPPGWRTHHPISGDAEIASKVSEEVAG